MLFEIKHYSNYQYNQPVVLEPHFLRFRPREDPFQKILDFNISINPKPTGISEYIDLDGNTAFQAWFNGSFMGLNILATTKIETNNTNPFSYLVYPKSALRLPMDYPQNIENLLKPYRASIANSVEVFRFAKEMAHEVDWQTIAFLMRLTDEINHKFQKGYREVGEPYSPEKTLWEKKGTCRDLTVLFMDICRIVGFAARFVSGYYFDELSQETQYLHSWVEVYIPGGGWRGFDPSNGLAAADRHIAVAASAIPGLSTPVTGTFLGNAVCTLTTDVTLSSL